jgi:hypothetical protein
MGEWKSSLCEYVSGFGKFGWIMTVGFLASSGGLAINAIFGVNPLYMPYWLWLVLALTTAIAAPFMAFHRVYQSLQQARSALEAEPSRVTPNDIYEKLASLLADDRNLPDWHPDAAAAVERFFQPSVCAKFSRIRPDLERGGASDKDIRERIRSFLNERSKEIRRDGNFTLLKSEFLP